MASDTTPPAVAYPCEVPIKAMGLAQDDFDAFVVAIVRRHVADIPEGAISARPSANGKYISVTVNIVAQSREHLESIYRELRASERVLMTL